MSYLAANELKPGQKVIPLRPVSGDGLQKWKASAAPAQKTWVEESTFNASAGQFCALPGDTGSVAGWLSGMEKDGWLYQLAALPTALPAGVYRLDCDWTREQRLQASLGWGLAAYRFERYKANGKPRPLLLLDDDIAGDVRALCDAQTLVRDLVNTPTEHLGPAELAEAVRREADAPDGAEYSVVTGDDLLTQDFPAIHAVGRASSRAPRLVELTWGDEDAPLLCLVGKGVCFDTGGLDLKPASGMALMKKDMGGAAHVLALARLVMGHPLPVRLQLLIPAVENSVSGNAYRPGDVIGTRKGLSVEIGNTDAEGRVVLADALAYACEGEPDLVIDFATLTGAARVALGADLPPLFANRAAVAQGVAQGIQQAGDDIEDPLWTMPLWQPYRKQIESPLADLNNCSKSSYGGCITAALFLESFVAPGIPWVHIDTFAWNEANRPGRPMGGEALGLRAVFRYLQARYA
ncbi:MAG: leucyl aminopeptidase family protein [Lysobacterales bacterium]